MKAILNLDDQNISIKTDYFSRVNDSIFLQLDKENLDKLLDSRISVGARKHDNGYEVWIDDIVTFSIFN